VTTLVAEWRRPVPPLPEMKTPKRAARFNRQISAIADRNLAGTVREVVEEVAPSDLGDEPIDNDGEATKSAINAVVIATALFDHKPWNFALIEDGLRRKTFIGHVGEGLFPQNEVFTVIEITEDRVIIREGTSPRLTYLEKGDSSGPGSSSGGKPTNQNAPDGKAAINKRILAGVKKKGEGKYDVSRDSIDTVLSNLSALSTDARVVPDFKGGKQRGFKLFSIKPKSVFSKIGLKNGDVLQTVNGYTLSSPDKILEVYGKLKDSEQISVEVLRRGKARSFEYSIR
jgi:general secretion pathway protein C